jgi:hypothetical protein
VKIIRGFQNVAVIVLVIMLIGLDVQMDTKFNRLGGNDFSSFILSAKLLLNGKNPYHSFRDKIEYIIKNTLKDIEITGFL